jgi:hypothetical protein
MAKLTAEMATALAEQLYDNKLADDAAESIAHMVSAMVTYSRRLESLNLVGIQPPLGYATLQAEGADST